MLISVMTRTRQPTRRRGFQSLSWTTYEPMSHREDSLMTSEELEEQRKWDEEFRRRSEDLARQELQSRERRRATSARLTSLKQRWEGVERRRLLRSRQGFTSCTPDRPTPPAVVITGVEAGNGGGGGAGGGGSGGDGVGGGSGGGGGDDINNNSSSVINNNSNNNTNNSNHNSRSNDAGSRSGMGNSGTASFS
ncbi:protein no-on-transient A isoform X2 [Aplysia californica]|uniref:Protein no-on-transient A isoform X2 n=1 Tax=Aplysia californica TaxID=6500 RepID=A0ABM0JVK6_APLCA|nr:protein no-on-transient A isoform X2 [Aplysia californica]